MGGVTILRIFTMREVITAQFKSHDWMWTAAKRKKEARRRHASNINAGYVEVDEYHLYRTGIRGRKSLVVWCVLVSLIIIALANLALNCFLIAVLQLAPNGLPYLVFIGNSRVLFPKPLIVPNLEVNSTVSGYYNHSLNLNSDRMFSLYSGAGSLHRSELLLDPPGSAFKPFNQFKLINASTDQELMTLNRSVAWIGKLKPVEELHSNRIITNILNCSTVTSGFLIVKAKTSLSMSASAFKLSSGTGDVRMSFKKQGAGLVVKQKEKDLHLLFPKLQEVKSDASGQGNRLCICENGRVFRAAEGSCSLSNNKYSPCRTP